MVIVVVKNFGGSSDSSGIPERKRTQPPDGWIGESRVVKKRQVGERAGRLQHILEISTNKEINGNGETDTCPEPPHSPIKKIGPSPIERVKKDDYQSIHIQNRRKSKVAEMASMLEGADEEKDWKSKLKKMQDQIKAVQDLPEIEVPKIIQHKKMTSASSPDLTLYSTPAKQHYETSWEIRARYRNMRTEELYMSQGVKKSGYSWREKVPEIQRSLKFSEVRSNAVTDTSFIGFSYVKDKPQEKKEEKIDKSKSPQFMTKIYKIDKSVEVDKIVIIDKIRRKNSVQIISKPNLTKLQPLECKANGVSTPPPFMVLLCSRLLQLMNFFGLKWQLKLCYPGYDFCNEIIKLNAALKSFETIMEVDELPELEEVKKPEIDEQFSGDIKSKMTGAIAGMSVVKRETHKKKALPDKNPTGKVEATKVSTSVGASDWRSEIKKRERAKQQEKLNAMPLGMPDYREPEKGQVFDWRAKLKEDEKDENPMNKWKKFDTGVKKTVRPPPLKPKPKPSLVPKEDPCTCNIGNCKIHFKFALKSTAKRQESVKVEEPLKRKASIKKKSDSTTPSSTSKLKKSDSDAKVPKLNQDKTKAVKETSAQPERKKKEVIKIINFVAIKVVVDEEQPEPIRKHCVKKAPDENKEKPPLPISPPPPPPKDTSPPSPTPPPLKDPTPPPKLPTPPPPPRPPSPPPKEPSPTPILETTPLPPPKKKIETPPTSPVYQRKFFPNPTPSEPFKPKVRDYTPVTVKLKRTDYYEEETKLTRRRYDNDSDVKPLQFSSVPDNCIKKALFLGDQYMGHQNNKEETSESKSTQYKVSRIATSDTVQNVKGDEIQSIMTEEADVNHNCDIKLNGNAKEDNTSINKKEERRNSVARNTKVNFKEPAKESPTHISQIRGSSWRDGFSMERSRSKSMTPIQKDNSNSKTKVEDEKHNKMPKKKASTKIIDILTAKKIRDENSVTTTPSTSPKLCTRRLSEYVSEKLRQSSKSRSNTPASPFTKRRSGLAR